MFNPYELRASDKDTGGWIAETLEGLSAALMMLQSMEILAGKAGVADNPEYQDMFANREAAIVQMAVLNRVVELLQGATEPLSESSPEFVEAQRVIEQRRQKAAKESSEDDDQTKTLKDLGLL